MFPDMSSLPPECNFHYDKRQLLGLRASDIDKLGFANHMIYLCYDKKARLPHNKFLEKLSGVNIYGDGFWFMLHRDFDEHEGPSFIHMTLEVIENLLRGELAEKVLLRLLAILRE